MAATIDWGVRVGSLTDVGRHRKRNEDSLFAFVPSDGGPGSWVGGAFAVADGMGGHDAGDVASQFIVAALESTFQPDGIFAEAPSAPLLATLESLLHAINERLHDLSEERGAVRGMGSTLTLAVFYRGRVYLAHVGDSRLYRLRNGVLQQLSQDHSWAAEQRRKGLITAEEEERHPQRNLLTECIGVDRRVNVQVRAEPVAPGDRYFLCSDGLHGQVRKADLAAVLSTHEDPQSALRRLIDAANQAGGPDNITGVIIDIGPNMDPGDVWPTAAESGADETTQPITLARGNADTGEHETVPDVTARRSPASLIQGLGEDTDVPDEIDPLEMTAVFPRRGAQQGIGWVPHEDYLTEEPPTVPMYGPKARRRRAGRLVAWAAVVVIVAGGAYALVGRGTVDDAAQPGVSADPHPATTPAGGGGSAGEHRASPLPQEGSPAPQASDPAAITPPPTPRAADSTGTSPKSGAVPRSKTVPGRTDPGTGRADPNDAGGATGQDAGSNGGGSDATAP